jgi:hypothetical protein
LEGPENILIPKLTENVLGMMGWAFLRSSVVAVLGLMVGNIGREPVLTIVSGNIRTQTKIAEVKWHYSSVRDLW